MASEWEELERLTKEELIIELVKERTAHRMIDWKLRTIVEMDHPADRKIPVILDGEGEGCGAPTDEWAYRIALRAFESAADKDDFCPYDLIRYGLGTDQAEEAYRRLRTEGIVTNPEHDLEGWF